MNLVELHAEQAGDLARSGRVGRERLGVVRVRDELRDLVEPIEPASRDDAEPKGWASSSLREVTVRRRARTSQSHCCRCSGVAHFYTSCPLRS